MFFQHPSFEQIETNHLILFDVYILYTVDHCLLNSYHQLLSKEHNTFWSNNTVHIRDKTMRIDGFRIFNSWRRKALALSTTWESGKTTVFKAFGESLVQYFGPA